MSNKVDSLSLAARDIHGPPHSVKISLGWLWWWRCTHCTWLNLLFLCNVLISYIKAHLKGFQIEKFAVFAVSSRGYSDFINSQNVDDYLFAEQFLMLQKISFFCVCFSFSFHIFWCSCFYGVLCLQVHKERDEKIQQNNTER